MFNKGFSRIVELLFTLIIISLSSTVFSFLSYRFNSDGEYLYNVAFNTLFMIEERGALSLLVYYEDWETLTNYVKSFIPADVKFRIIIYDESFNVLYSYQMDYSMFTRMVSVPFILKFKGVSRIVVLEIWR